ncbi:MAG: hypothetical protein NTAFB05_12930 [Nitrobacter sp.]
MRPAFIRPVRQSGSLRGQSNDIGREAETSRPTWIMDKEGNRGVVARPLRPGEELKRVNR